MDWLFKDGALVAELFEVQLLFHVHFVIGAWNKLLAENRIAVAVLPLHRLHIKLVSGLDANSPNTPVVRLLDR